MSKAFDALQNPARAARVGTRWWWYGCAVTREEIHRELEAMAAVGLGMVEIQIIYETEADDPAIGQKHIDYFSPEFFDMLDYTLTCAASLDIDVDFTLGSGWPFGGSFVEDTMAPAILVPYQHDVMGPCRFSFDYTCVLNGEIERVILCPISDGVMDHTRARDITEQVKPTYIYSWQWGSCLGEVEIPDGLHKIYTFVIQKYKQNIGKPAPHMHGLAIDHCRRDVVDTYMRTMGQTLIDRLGRDKFHGFFCDSIELAGNNWSVALLEAFKARRGYDLSPYMPALWGDMGEVTPRVRNDYFETFGEMALEGFFDNFAGWCRRFGVQSRTQAHGIWADILKAYASADVPEGETFGEHDCYFVNMIHRRLAVSAGQLYGRPVVSNESFTWLRMPRYLVTPEMIKRAADAILVDGINLIVNHGFSYSPERVGKPGWNFYASSMINMNNTWWAYYPPLCAYVHRVSGLMQAGEIYSRVAVYLPQADVRSESPMAEMHMALRLEEIIGRDMINAIQRAGYWITFVNDEILAQLEPGRFDAIVLAGAKRLPVETARALAKLDALGVRIVAVEALPDDTCGMIEYERRRQAVRQAMAGLANAIIAPDREAGILRALREACPPDLVVEGEAARDVGFIHRMVAGQHVYFVANIAAEARECNLSVPGIVPLRIVDPLTMTDVAPISVQQSDGRTYLQLAFTENQSVVLFVGEEGLLPQSARPEGEAVRLSGWTLRIDGETIAQDMPDPVGWEQFAASRHYSGEGEYETVFDWTGGEATLRMEGVACCCTVLLNGAVQGMLWMTPYQLQLSGLKKGRNRLTVRVVNTWINHVIGPAGDLPYSDEPVSVQWPYFNGILDDVRRRRLYPTREREMVKAPVPSGLTGPVYLVGDHFFTGTQIQQV